MLAHWWAKPDIGVWLQGPEVLELLSDHWWVEPIPDTAGCGVQGVPKFVGLLVEGAKTQLVPALVLAYWWVGWVLPQQTSGM